MNVVGIFPFGEPILPLVQPDRTTKRVFVLGVYASAVHARWIGEDGRQKIGAVAVASEPEIFWRGDQDVARQIVSAIRQPALCSTGLRARHSISSSSTPSAWRARTLGCATSCHTAA